MAGVRKGRLPEELTRMPLQERQRSSRNFDSNYFNRLWRYGCIDKYYL